MELPSHQGNVSFSHREGAAAGGGLDAAGFPVPKFSEIIRISHTDVSLKSPPPPVNETGPKFD